MYEKKEKEPSLFEAYLERKRTELEELEKKRDAAWQLVDDAEQFGGLEKLPEDMSVPELEGKLRVLGRLTDRFKGAEVPLNKIREAGKLREELERRSAQKESA